MLYAGYFVATPVEAIDILTRRMIAKSPHQSKRLVVIVFAHHAMPQAAQIVRLLPYWNYRSKDFIDFFFMGYQGDSETDDSDYVPVLGEDPFHEKAFVESVEYFESQSDWKYSGRLSAVVSSATLKYRKSDNKARAFFDFSSILDWRLAEALDAKIVQSVEGLFEVLIRAANNQKSILDIGDQIGIPALGSAVWNVLLDNLPVKSVKQTLQAADFWSVRSRKNK